MDIALIIFATLSVGLACRSHTIPLSLPVFFLLVLSLVFTLEYAPTMQTALTMNTPLILKGWFHESLSVDGLSLLFALLTTSIGTIATVYGAFSLDEPVYRRFASGLLVVTSGLLALVLINDADLVLFPLAGVSVGAVWLIRFGSRDLIETIRSDRSWILVGISIIVLLVMRVGISALEKSGGIAKQLPNSLTDINQLSTANLSKSSDYALVFGCLVAGMILAGLCLFWIWYRSKNIFTLSQVFLPVTILITLLYPFARFYPALHDNPLWWNVLTGVGLLMMLLGAVWALRQSDLNRVLMCMTFSTFGVCLALLGLPAFSGVRTALIGIGVYSLILPALFLSLNTALHRVGVSLLVGLSMLAMAVVDVWIIQAFYTLSLPWAGVALAVVVLSTALLTVVMLRILSGVGTWRAMSAQNAPRQIIVPMILIVAALLFILVFDPLFAPLLPMHIKTGADIALAAALVSVLAWGGGGVLYATRGAWGGQRETDTAIQV